MNTKKLMSVLIGLVLLLALFAGCAASNEGAAGNASTENADAGDAGAGEENAALSPVSGDVTIGLLQLVEHPSLDTIRLSFEAEMEALGYGHIAIDYQNGQGDMTQINAIAQKFVGDGVDVIVPIATPAAIGCAGATDSIPIVFAAVTDPVIADLVSDLEHPDRNVTGVSDAIPAADIFGLAAQLTPEAKTFGFLYNPGEPNSVSVINDAKAYCDANGLSYLEATVAESSDVQQAAQSLVGRVDAFFTPIDNTVATAMPIYAQVAIDNSIPLYPGADSMVEDGGLATFGIDYTELGRRTAQMVVQVLEGADVADLPVVILDDFRLIANQTTADALNIDLSGVEGLEIVD